MIAIIGILVSLLLPAVQAAREAARRMQCGNNLKQIGLALHNYHASFKSFPAGAYWKGTNYAAYRGSILIRLLPFLEQQALHDAFDHDARPINQTFTSGPSSGKKIGATIVAAYVCPSDTNRGLFNGRGIHCYAASQGPTAHANSPSHSCAIWASWNAYALAPYERPPNFAGPFYRRGHETNIADCRDGLSNTIYFGEVRPECSAHARNGWAGTNNGHGLTSTQVPINYDSCDDKATDGCQHPANWNTELAFKSNHPGGAQFCFGDGSVHFLSESIEHWTYQYLGGKADGEPVTLP